MLSYDINILKLLQMIVNYLNTTLPDFVARGSLSYEKISNQIHYHLLHFLLSEVLTVSVINCKSVLVGEYHLSSFSPDEDKILPSKPMQQITLEVNPFGELANENHSESSNKFALIPF